MGHIDSALRIAEGLNDISADLRNRGPVTKTETPKRFRSEMTTEEKTAFIREHGSADEYLRLPYKRK